MGIKREKNVKKGSGNNSNKVSNPSKSISAILAQDQGRRTRNRTGNSQTHTNKWEFIDIFYLFPVVLSFDNQLNKLKKILNEINIIGVVNNHCCLINYPHCFVFRWNCRNPLIICTCKLITCWCFSIFYECIAFLKNWRSRNIPQ